MRVCFLTSSRGNHFMTELLEGVAAAVAREGVEVAMAADAYPDFDDDTVWIAIPHEFFDTAPRGGRPTERHLQRTIGFCVEHPGTPWFYRTCLHARRLGALVDIRAASVWALKQNGLAAEHFALGYVPEWDRWREDESVERPVEVLYLASAEARRGRMLASYAETLWARRCRLIVAPRAPKTGPAPDYLVGAQKHELLRASRTLLNVHREGAVGLEWFRVIECISNGCVVVSEHCDDFGPLVPGEHFVSGHAEHLALLAEGLLEDPQRLAEIRLAAYRQLRSELSMRAGVGRLLAMGHALSKKPIRYGAFVPGPVPDPPAIDESSPLQTDGVRATLKRLSIDLLGLRSDLSRSAAGASAGTMSEVLRTGAYGAVSPHVTVGISVYNYEHEVPRALGSVCASDFTDYEILVVDDASTDGSVKAVKEFAADHPTFPLRLLSKQANEGPGPARNALIAAARGKYVFVLDADNTVFPPSLGRLVAALDADRDAAFAYGMLAVYQGEVPVDLLSWSPWDPARLRFDNTIDMMALLRREAVEAVGGFSPDRRLAGFEDYDLWCRLAEQHKYGVLVPQIVGQYQRSQHSMLSLTTIDTSHARSLMRTRAPRVWGDADTVTQITRRLPADRLVAGLEHELVARPA